MSDKKKLIAGQWTRKWNNYYDMQIGFKFSIYNKNPDIKKLLKFGKRQRVI